MVVSYVRDRERIFLRWPQGDLRDTVTNPDYVTVDASRDRLHLADSAGVLELALDASDSIDAKNSLEKMLVHQMATVHRSVMKLAIRLEDMQLPVSAHPIPIPSFCTSMRRSLKKSGA